MAEYHCGAISLDEGEYMFWRKKRDLILVLTIKEKRRLTTSMPAFRNRLLAAGKPAGEFNGLANGASLQLSPDIISRKYPDEAPSLYNLIRETEDSMKKLV